LMLGVSVSPVWSDDAPKPPAPATAEEAADPFAVPETNDDKALQMFLQRLVQTQPAAPSPEAIAAHLTKIDGVVGKVLAKPISDPFYRSVAELRLQLYSVLEDVGDASAKAKRDAYLKELSESKRPGVSELATRFALQQQIESIPTLGEAQQKALLEQVVNLVKSAPAGDDEALQFAVQTAMTAGELLQRADSPLATPGLEAIVAAIKARNDERLADLVASLEGTLRRLQLPGKAMEVAGKTVDGNQFNITSLKGKVVLVDFWATWCGPCIQELPHLTKLYEGYHDKGFEIVGISLDSDREELEGFLKARQIKWPILFDDAEGQGFENKIAIHYGISAIPTMILVNQEGKVVSTNVRGPVLDEELAKLLGPLPKTEKAEKK
ncbi:MAG TPA: TlpA disulfide reductase family protein, partial [Planctomicrobium sp.]|nr:TlpA disulfide reductase family protein [Planctomicrobium sp.]